MKQLSQYLSLFFLLAYSFTAFSQEENVFQHNYLIVEGFEMEGNKRTKESYILRELKLAQGDTIYLDNLKEVLDENIGLLYSTQIFASVKMDTFAVRSPYCKVKIEFTENLSIYPIPVFKLIDRNFNVWWNEFDHDFNRITWGGFVRKNNLRGQNETLTVQALWGYSRTLDFRYNFPYINKKKTLGLYVRTSFRSKREASYQTFENKEQFYNHNERSNNRFSFDLTLKRRKELKQTHFLKFIAQSNTVADTLLQLNPDYFNESASRQRYLAIRYLYEFNTRDIRRYPTKGFYFRGEIHKNGLGVFKDLNILETRANVSYYHPIRENLILSNNLRLHKTWGKDQPYFNTSRLGYRGNTVRGYEYYVMPNQEYLMFRTNLRQRLWAVEFIDPFYWKKRKKMSFKGYARAHYETAYARDKLFDEGNALTNIWQHGMGLGLDIVFWETVPVSFEYNRNHLNESHFYLHFGLEWGE